MRSVLLPWPALLPHQLPQVGFFRGTEEGISIHRRERICLGVHLSAPLSAGINAASCVTQNNKSLLKTSTSAKAKKWESSGSGGLNQMQDRECKDTVQLWVSLVSARCQPRLWCRLKRLEIHSVLEQVPRGSSCYHAYTTGDTGRWQHPDVFSNRATWSEYTSQNLTFKFLAIICIAVFHPGLQPRVQTCFISPCAANSTVWQSEQQLWLACGR